jgi:hypothetical protein
MKKWSTTYLLRTSVTSLSFSFIIISTPVYGADRLTYTPLNNSVPSTSQAADSSVYVGNLPTISDDRADALPSGFQTDLEVNPRVIGGEVIDPLVIGGEVIDPREIDPRVIGEQVCFNRPPTCSSLGYSTASCPSGSSALLCPLDTKYKICIPGKVCDAQLYTLSSCPDGATCKSCKGKYRLLSCKAGQYLTNNLSCKSSTSCNDAAVGDYVYGDKTCSSERGRNANGYYPVGVIIDTQRRLMIDTCSSGTYSSWSWGTTLEDISGLPNYTSEASASADFDGKEHTKVMFDMEYGYNPAYHSSTAVASCYDYTLDDDWSEYQTSHTSSSGYTSTSYWHGWYMPALGELKLLYSVKNIIEPKLSAECDGLGYNAGNREIFLSSTEYDANYVWAYRVSDNTVHKIHKDDYDSNQLSDTSTDNYTVRCFHKY